MTGATVNARVNGEARALPAGTTIADLVPAEWKQGVAVARNEAIVPRATWAATAVIEGDAIEIVRPVQGG
ncbi:MAG: sulfur carrier protein ThiS [Chloroflexi bacterium]|nr:sulfur carrier protein ThiS [Chloroflexota bacterium]